MVFYCRYVFDEIVLSTSQIKFFIYLSNIFSRVHKTAILS